MKTVIEVGMIFDDVQFGIDVRDARVGFGWTQDYLALLVGYADGNSISRIECATSADSMTIRRYMSVCNVLHLHPMHYWDIVPPAYEQSDWSGLQDHA